MKPISYHEFKAHLKQEQAFYKRTLIRRILWGKSDVGQYLYHMRYVEWCMATSCPPFNIIIHLLRIFHQRRMHVYARYTGLQIGLGTTDWGIRIYHHGHIIINCKATIGRNLTIYPGVTIGAHKGVPTIGDNVFIGLGAKVIGHITVGDNAMVAPNAVVTKDVPANCIVAGVPAKVISTQKYQKQ